MVSFRALIVIGLWSGLRGASAVPTTVPIPPSQDPFYSAPDGFERAKLGAVLRRRPVPGLVSIIANSSAAHNILYRTTDAKGQPSWAVTTLLSPKPLCDSRSKKIISYQIAYDTPAVDWSPSYGLFNVYSQQNGVGFPPESAQISEALGRGWYVTVPDYEGPQASFLAGLQSGHAILDGLRASISTDIIGPGNVQVVLWGYSGGGFATAWAAELQPHYAPDLKISGAAVGAPPTNATTAITDLNNSTFMFLVPSAIIGLVSQFPVAKAALINALNKDGPFNATGWFAATQRNFIDNLFAFANQDVLDYFIGRQQPFDLPPVSALVKTQTVLGTYGTPTIPYFAYAAIDDRIVGIAGIDKVVSQYCASGANILYHRNTVGGHIAETTNGVPRAFDFIDAVFGGTFVPAQGCTVENVTVALSTASDPLR